MIFLVFSCFFFDFAGAESHRRPKFRHIRPKLRYRWLKLRYIWLKLRYIRLM